LIDEKKLSYLQSPSVRLAVPVSCDPDPTEIAEEKTGLLDCYLTTCCIDRCQWNEQCPSAPPSTPEFQFSCSRSPSNLARFYRGFLFPGSIPLNLFPCESLTTVVSVYNAVHATCKWLLTLVFDPRTFVSAFELNSVGYRLRCGAALEYLRTGLYKLL